MADCSIPSFILDRHDVITAIVKDYMLANSMFLSDKLLRRLFPL